MSDSVDVGAFWSKYGDGVSSSSLQNIKTKEHFFQDGSTMPYTFEFMLNVETRITSLHRVDTPLIIRCFMSYGLDNRV